MDFKEISNLELYQEQEHWWIKTRFQYIEKAIEKLEGKPFTFLEIGCGSGQNLSFLGNTSKYKEQLLEATGVDTALPVDFKRDDLNSKITLSRQMPDATKRYDILCLMDVLEHLENPEEQLALWLKYLNPNGIVLITVPAYEFLWSNHDVLLGHYRRYTRTSLQMQLKNLKLKGLYNRYAFSFVFPLVLMLRKLNKKDTGKSDLKMPARWLNTILYRCGYLEKKWGGCRFFGTSVIGIYQK